MSQPENPFEAGDRKVIPAVLVYLRYNDQILMIHRIPKGSRKDDHAGKWNGLGGKCELNESPLEAAKREVHEEAGIDFPIQQFHPLGFLQFPNFKADKHEDWIVFVFSCNLNQEQTQAIQQEGCEEGDLHWVPISQIMSLALWPGDSYFLPFVLEGRPFMGTIWYEGSQVTKHWVTALVPC